MDTTSMVLLIYGLCFVIAITIVALVTVNALKPQSSKAVLKKKSKGGRRVKSARKVKTARQPVLKSGPVRAAQRRPAPPRKRRVKPEPVEYEIPEEVDETWKAAHSQGAGPWSGRKRMDGIAFSTGKKAGGETEQPEDTGQAKPESAVPVGSAESEAAPKDDSMSRTAPASTPPVRPSATEPKIGEKPPQKPPAATTGEVGRKGTASVTYINTAGKKADDQNKPIEAAKQAPQGGSVDRTAPAGAPRGQSAPVGAAGNYSSDTVEPEEEDEAGMSEQPDTEGDRDSSEPPAATADSDDEEEEEEQAQKSGMGDLADLFSKSADDFTEKSKLADEVEEVDVDDVLQEGLGLLDRFKRPGE